MTLVDNLDVLLSQINSKSILDCTDKQVQKELTAMEYAPTCLLQPAGKRPREFGLDDGWQGIIHVDRINERRASVKVTYLAAGFVFGNKGQSIQDISERAHVKTQSWCAQFSENIINIPRELRVWHICGEPEAIYQAVKLISKAVDRYRELIGGQYKDQVVRSEQEVCGIKFFYKPPPIHKMPNSARTVYFCEKPSDYGNQKAALRRTQSQGLNNSVRKGTQKVVQKADMMCKNAGMLSNQGRGGQYMPQYMSWVPYYQNDYATYAPYATYMPLSMIPAPGAPYNVSYAGHLQPNPPANIPHTFATATLPTNGEQIYYAQQHYVR